MTDDDPDGRRASYDLGRGNRMTGLPTDWAAYEQGAYELRQEQEALARGGGGGGSGAAGLLVIVVLALSILFVLPATIFAAIGAPILIAIGALSGRSSRLPVYSVFRALLFGSICGAVVACLVAFVAYIAISGFGYRGPGAAILYVLSKAIEIGVDALGAFIDGRSFSLFAAARSYTSSTGLVSNWPVHAAAISLMMLPAIFSMEYVFRYSLERPIFGEGVRSQNLLPLSAVTLISTPVTVWVISRLASSAQPIGVSALRDPWGLAILALVSTVVTAIAGGLLVRFAIKKGVGQLAAPLSSVRIPWAYFIYCVLFVVCVALFRTSDALLNYIFGKFNIAPLMPGRSSGYGLSFGMISGFLLTQSAGALYCLLFLQSEFARLRPSASTWIPAALASACAPLIMCGSVVGVLVFLRFLHSA